jgi:hypothetical protein
MLTPGRYAQAFSRTPFSFFVAPDGTIKLHGEIRDAEGTIVVEAIGDSIRVLQANRYDLNSDSRAIEVVDSSQRPLFQLIVVPYETFLEQRAQLRSQFEETLRQRIEAAGIPDANKFLGNLGQPTKERTKVNAPSDVIRLSYVAQQGETWLISSSCGTEMVKTLDEFEWSRIPRLFCYPGYLYPGKRVSQQGK